MSAHISRRALERLEFYDGFMRPNRLRDLLKVWLWSSTVSAACIQLWRHDGEFSRHEQEMLAILHHHLIRLREEGLDDNAVVNGRRAGLTPREAEVMSWVALGASDDEIAARLGMAPATVAKHLEHAYAALGVHSRAQAIGAIVSAPNGRQSRSSGRRSGGAQVVV